jgi:hypothetical protein
VPRLVTLSGFAALENGSTFAVEIVDLSYDGCKIDAPIALLPRLRLKISVDGTKALFAEVRWCRDGQAGLQFSPEPASHKPETPRQQPRHAVAAEVSLRRSSSKPYYSRVFDLTAAGCKIEFVERPRHGELVWAKFEGLEAVESIVRWVDGFYGGVEFVRALHPAVYDLLLTKLQKGAPARSS